VDDERELRRIASEPIHDLAGDPARAYPATSGQLSDETRELLHRLAAATQDEIAEMRCGSVLSAREGDLLFAAWLAQEADALEAAQLPGRFWARRGEI
jgi:hypothetical protein